MLALCEGLLDSLGDSEETHTSQTEQLQKGKAQIKMNLIDYFSEGYFNFLHFNEDCGFISKREYNRETR